MANWRSESSSSASPEPASQWTGGASPEALAGPTVAVPSVAPSAAAQDLPRRRPLRAPEAVLQEIDDGTPPSPSQVISDRPLLGIPADPWADPRPPWWQRTVLGMSVGIWLMLLLVVIVGVGLLVFPQLLPERPAAPSTVVSPSAGGGPAGNGGVGVSPTQAASGGANAEPSTAVSAPATGSASPVSGTAIVVSSFQSTWTLLGWQVTIVLANPRTTAQTWRNVSVQVPGQASFVNVPSWLLVTDAGHTVCATPRSQAAGTIAAGATATVQFTITSLLSTDPAPTQPQVDNPVCGGTG